MTSAADFLRAPWGQLQPVPFRLSEDDVAWAEQIAVKMEEHPRTEATRSYAKNGIRSHRIGAMGEIAVARNYGVELKPVFGRRDSGWDVEINGFKVQVKTSTYWKKKTLFVYDHEQRTADLFMLVLINGATATGEIVGYAPAKKVFSRPKTLHPLEQKDKEPNVFAVEEAELVRPLWPEAVRLTKNGWTWKIRLEHVIWTHPDVGVGGWYQEEVALDLDRVLQETGRNPVNVRMEQIRAQADRKSAMGAVPGRRVDPGDQDQVRKTRRKKEAAGQTSLVEEGTQ